MGGKRELKREGCSLPVMWILLPPAKEAGGGSEYVQGKGLVLVDAAPASLVVVVTPIYHGPNEMYLSSLLSLSSLSSLSLSLPLHTLSQVFSGKSKSGCWWWEVLHQSLYSLSLSLPPFPTCTSSACVIALLD